MQGQVIGNLDTGVLSFHDVALDYYGKRLAAACGAPAVPDDKGLPEGDYTVHIWDITDGQQNPMGQLKGHDGPVWKVVWAHPKFGSLIATCSYDMKVIIWKEVPNQGWQRAYIDTSHSASVNDIEFCPWEHGLRLACASSDGTVSVLTYLPAEARWARSVIQAHPGGALTVSWCPSTQRDHGPQMRLATGGCDHAVNIWKCNDEVWTQETPLLLPAHRDWVRKVSWRPDGSSTVASGSWDKTVAIWKQEIEGQPWRQIAVIPASGKVESLAWSVTGSILAISFDQGETVLYKEGFDGRYEEVAKCNETGYSDTAPKPASLPVGFEVPQPVGAPQPAAGGLAASLSGELAAAQQQQQAQQAAQQASVLESFGM